MMNLIIFIVLAACWYSICWLKEELGEAKAKQIKANEILKKQHQCMKNMAKLLSSLQTRLKSTETDVLELEKWADKIDAELACDKDDDEEDDEDSCSFEYNFDPSPCCCEEDISDIKVSFAGSPDLYASEEFAGGCGENVEWDYISFTPLDIDLTDPNTATKLKEQDQQEEKR